MTVLNVLRTRGRYGSCIRRVLDHIVSNTKNIDGLSLARGHVTVHTEPTTHVLFSSRPWKERYIHISRVVAEDPVSSSTSYDLRMTRAAVEKIKELQKKRKDPGLGLRLLVSGGGCSGFQYVFEIDSNVGKDDHVLEEDGVRIVCDDVSLNFVRGSTIDYESDLIQSKFVVSENPNAEIGCGCGSSFGVQMS
jgi:iron-sulfur cluster assembly accessory protein